MCSSEDYANCPAAIHMQNREREINEVKNTVAEVKTSVRENVKILNEKMDKVKGTLTAFSFTLAGTLAGGIILFVLSQGGKP